MFLLAIVAVTAAMLVAVLFVLRPLRGPSTKMFPSEQMIGLWEADDPLTDEAIHHTYVASSLSTLSDWHFRSRLKARWLRRAYVLLGAGILLIATGIALILNARSVLEWYWSVVVLVLASAAFAIGLRFDLFYAGWRAGRKAARD